ncbi:hypothetical protein CANARDRAFT_30778 [[Candida] arabinofermentans NRRL YB-2248]|uniref:Aminotransferase class III n=1 Tax=[Candida] arabinofermentans NRRL YB-2248 TaxID=983967 RepID=A0A1E4SSL1_9ASCO|nr:hypothetical protein CANARDRAFT_30778 [[Candida] arabinofermentans NRRL YB-2248]
MTVQSRNNTSFVFQRKINDKGLLCVGAKPDGKHIILEDPATKEQKVIFDAVSGAAVSSLGHCDPEITALMGEYAKESVYTFGAYFANYAAEELGEFLCDKSEGAFASALWTASGSEANENALKIMKQYHLELGDKKRFKFISRKQSYHGFTVGTLSIGDGSRKYPFKDILLSDEQTPKISPCYAYRGVKEGVTEEQYTKMLLDELEQTFIDNDPSTVAGVIFETVCGSTFGTPTPTKGYLDGAKAIAHKYGALFMLDEVMCGLGRCGYPFTFMHPDFGLTTGGPDLCAVGKTIGSGFVTLAGLLVSPGVKSVFENGSGYILGGQTYHSHDFNCRVGLAVQKKIYRDNLIENVRETGEYLKQQLKEKLKDSKIAGDVRGAGNFLSVEIVSDKATKEPFATSVKAGPTVAAKCFEKGMTAMGVSGTLYSKVEEDGTLTMVGDHVTVAPAFIFTKADADFISTTIADSLFELEAQQFGK